MVFLMAYKKTRTPTEFTGCGNHECQIRKGCERYEKRNERHFINSFNPERRRGELSCAMRIEAAK